MLEKMQVLIFILLLIYPSMYVHGLNYNYELNDTEAYPLIIGYSQQDRYVLYSNNIIYKILSNGTLQIYSKLPSSMNITNYTILDMDIVENYVCLYLYKNINNTSGFTEIIIWNKENKKTIYNKTFNFIIKNKTNIYGGLVTIAAFSSNGLALIASNSTSTYIYVYRMASDKLELFRIYNITYSYTLYKYNNTILGIVPYTGTYYNKTVLIPNLVDLFTNNSLFEIPALIPVIPFATPMIQVFKNTTDWLIHITVINRFAHRIEYYLTKPNSYELKDSLKASFSPTMDCAVIELQNGAMIMFPDGTKYFLNKYLPIIPREVFMLIDPSNGILDVDKNTHRVLLKYNYGNKTKIYLLENNKLYKIYELPAKYSLKSNGFYGAIKGNYAFLIDPGKHKLIKINLEEVLKSSNESDSNKTKNNIYIYLLITIFIVIFLIVILLIKYRYKLKLK